jgi:hypothetical protein
MVSLGSYPAQIRSALKLVIEPVFEADFRPVSFGFRPKKAAHDALQVLLDESFRGSRWVMETDIANCFSAIPHDRLMSAATDKRICDRKVLKLLRAMLASGVMEDGTVRRPVSGTPQGGVVSPLLCNVYLNRLDRAWETEGSGTLVRYADDLLVTCRSRAEAEAALRKVTALLADLGLQPKADKTRIVPWRWEARGSTFSASITVWCAPGVEAEPSASYSWPAGPHVERPSTPATGYVSSRTEGGCWFLSKKSSGASTGSCAAGPGSSGSGTRLAPSTRSGSTRSTASEYSSGTFIANTGGGVSGGCYEARTNSAWSPQRIRRRSQTQPGLAGSHSRTPPVKNVGEPCAGEPHARFDVAGAGNGAVTATEHGSPRETKGPEPGPAYHRHRASARPYQPLSGAM